MAKTFSEFETVAACPVCAAAGPFIRSQEFICRCRNCGVYFANPRPTQAQIAASYDEGSNYDLWARDNTGRDFMWEQRVKLLGPDALGAELLDIGAGDGYFLRVARRHGYVCLGTELSEEGARRARAEGIEVRVGQFCDLDFHGRQFDVITIWHVLEHVPNPGEVLAHAYALLRPGGRFAVAVPNEDNAFVNHRLGRRSSDGPLSAPAWGGEIHLTHFQKSTLKRALRQAGFQVERMGVDDIYSWTSRRRWFVLELQKMSNRLFGWHFSMAMFAVCRKPSSP